MTTVADHVANNAISGATWNFTVLSTALGDLGTVEVGCQSLGTQYTTLTVTDNAPGGSSAWTQRLVNLTGSGGRSIYVAHCLALKAGATLVTVTLNGGTGGTSGISAYQRFNGSGTWSTDQSGSTSSTAAGATATITASSVNVGTTDAVIAIGVLGNGDPTEGLSDPPTGSTWFSGAVSQNDSTSTSAEICYRVNTAAVTDSATWTSNAGGIVANCPAVIVSYKLTASGGTAPTVVQSKDNEGPNPETTSFTSLSTQFTAKTTLASALVAFLTNSCYGAAHTDITLIDSQGNPFTNQQQINGPQTNGNQPFQLQLLTALNILGDTSTADQLTSGFSIPFDNADHQAHFLLEVANVKSIIGSSQNAQLSLAPGTGNVNSGTAISVGAGQLPALMIALSFNQSGLGTTPAPTVNNMTQYANCWAFNSGNTRAVIATKAITTAGSYQAVFNQASSATEWMMTMAVILQGTGGAAPVFPIRRPRRLYSTVHYPR